MSSIKSHVANATGELDNLLGLIEAALAEALPVVEEELKANEIDIFFLSAPGLAMPDYGIGGNSPGPNHIYISFDPTSDKITKQGIIETLLHEIHHCMRWRKPGYGETLGEAMITEGLACLYEQEHSGHPPIYATTELHNKEINKAREMFDDKTYNHAEWFFGSKNINNWFGYTYGYQICKEYSSKHGLSSIDLINVNAKQILEDSGLS